MSEVPLSLRSGLVACALLLPCAVVAGDRDLWDPLTGRPPAPPPRAVRGSPGAVAPVGGPALDVAEQMSVPAGSFLMGSNAPGSWNDERPVHAVWVDAFLMDRHEVTNRRYAAFLQDTGRAKPTFWEDDRFNNPDQPVVGVSWDDAAAFCRWAGKRLPTEAEWERAARGGLEGKTYPWGDQEPGGRACFGLAGETAAPCGVGQYAPNGFGIYDLAGNVAEWCADWGDEEYYAHSEPRNPRGPATGTERIVRGGSYGPGAALLRCAGRTRVNPAQREAYIGIRCVKSP